VEARCESHTPNATVYVDGAESGPAPRSVVVAHKQLRRQRRQQIWLALIGTAIDFGLAAAFNINTADDGQEEYLKYTIPAGVGVLALDLYLITGRSVKEEGVETIPMPTEISVAAPGYTTQSRKIRVPEITQLEFELVPSASSQAEPVAAAKN
jgi:hypothetical protein